MPKSMSQENRQKLMVFDADRAEKHIHPNQPGRVKLGQISWHDCSCSALRLQLHAQDIAFDVVTHGTSKRRYQHVKLVEMPENRVKDWLALNKMKPEMNPTLADFEAMSHTGPYYASLGRTGFVEAHKLIKDGKRMFRDNPSGVPFVLKEDDEEGRLIQELGVLAVVYTAELWNDMPALLALMREDSVYVEMPISYGWDMD